MEVYVDHEPCSEIEEEIKIRIVEKSLKLDELLNGTGKVNKIYDRFFIRNSGLENDVDNYSLIGEKIIYRTEIKGERQKKKDLYDSFVYKNLRVEINEKAFYSAVSFEEDILEPLKCKVLISFIQI